VDTRNVIRIFLSKLFLYSFIRCGRVFDSWGTAAI
jgi:hypothetical protein